MKRKIDEGCTELQLADEHFGEWCRYYKAFERYKKLKKGNCRNWATFTEVYWGAPGLGKSRRAHHEYPDAYWLAKPRSGSSGAWWDSYDGEEVVIIDEFYGWISRDLMCRICDRYPLLVETKGGSVPLLAKKIIITSNKKPAEWWPRVGLGAMERRLSGELGQVTHMRVPWLPPVIGCLNEAESIMNENCERLQANEDLYFCDIQDCFNIVASDGIMCGNCCHTMENWRLPTLSYDAVESQASYRMNHLDSLIGVQTNTNNGGIQTVIID